MTNGTCPLFRSLSEAKRTCGFALQMSASDPKRTCVLITHRDKATEIRRVGPILDSSLRRSENLIQHNDAPTELNSLGAQGVVLVVYGDAARASGNDRSYPEISNRLSFLWVV